LDEEIKNKKLNINENLNQNNTTNMLKEVTEIFETLNMNKGNRNEQ